MSNDQDIRWTDAARAFVVVFGGPVVLDAAAAGGVTATCRALAQGRRPRLAALVTVGATVGYLWKLRPWLHHWGATDAEVTTRPAEPVDLAAATPDFDGAGGNGGGPVHAVAIDAPAEAVWPWVAQLGQDRGGFYSYEWLENLAGCAIRNADRIHPEWQHREIGEQVKLHPATGMPVTAFVPGRMLGLKGWGTFVVEPVDDGRSRLVVYSDPPAGRAGALYYAALVEIPHFVMERRMLLGIKKRAERAY